MLRNFHVNVTITCSESDFPPWKQQEFNFSNKSEWLFRNFSLSSSERWWLIDKAVIRKKNLVKMSTFDSQFFSWSYLFPESDTLLKYLLFPYLKLKDINSLQTGNPRPFKKVVDFCHIYFMKKKENWKKNRSNPKTLTLPNFCELPFFSSSRKIAFHLSSFH